MLYQPKFVQKSPNTTRFKLFPLAKYLGRYEIVIVARLDRLFHQPTVGIRIQWIYRSLLMFLSLTFVYQPFFQVFPLWSKASVARWGLDFDAFDIGIAHAISGPCGSVYQIFFYRKVANWFQHSLNVNSIFCKPCSLLACWVELCPCYD